VSVAAKLSFLWQGRDHSLRALLVPHESMVKAAVLPEVVRISVCTFFMTRVFVSADRLYSRVLLRTSGVLGLCKPLTFFYKGLFVSLELVRTQLDF
jgi:hypothetical protein